MIPLGQTDQPLIKANQVRKNFGQRSALRDFSIEIHPGQIFGLVGPDGAGKSTAMKIIAGLLKPDAGQVHVLGRDIWGGSGHEIENVRPELGFMPQGLGLSLSPRLTVQQNLEFFGQLFGLSDQQLADRQEYLQKVTQLWPFRSRLAKNLSGGMQQKLALCCTLVHRPRVLILDEPTTGVDPVARMDFWSLINDLSTEDQVSVFSATSHL